MGISASVFEPLVRGGAWIKDGLGWAADGLNMNLAALGGYWSLQLSIMDSQARIEEWIDDGLGRHVEVYNDSLDIIWEGFVSKVTANIGSLSLSRGPLLDTVANRVKCIYSTVDTSTTPPTVGVREDTDWAEDADSQDRYGIIERVVSVGGANATTAEQIRDTALDDLKDPATDERENVSSSNVPSATIDCLGYSHWFKAYTYSSTTTGTQNASAKLQAVLAGDPNNIFSTDYYGIATNTTQVGAWEQDDRVAWSIMSGIVALGDSSFNRYIFGIYAGRKPFYSAVPTTVDYQRRLSDPGQWIESYGIGGKKRPWEILPGKWVFYTDLLTGTIPATSLRADPRHLFIEQMSYSVPWALSLDGARAGRLDQLLARLGLAGAGA